MDILTSIEEAKLCLLPPFIHTSIVLGWKSLLRKLLMKYSNKSLWNEAMKIAFEDDYKDRSFPEATLLNIEWFELSEKFEKLLGVDEFSIYISVDWPDEKSMSEELKSLLQKIAGPNGRTIWRMYLINRGLKP